MNLNYEEDVKINENELHKEWLRQSDLAMKYSKHYVNKQNEVDRLKEKKKTVRSELIMEANDKAKEIFDKKRPNKNDIEAYYRTNDRYKEVVKKLNEAKYEKDMAAVARNEIAYTRKQALENLVKLHKSNYFSNPDTTNSKEMNKARENKEKKMENNISRSLNN